MVHILLSGSALFITAWHYLGSRPRTLDSTQPSTRKRQHQPLDSRKVLLKTPRPYDRFHLKCHMCQKNKKVNASRVLASFGINLGLFCYKSQKETYNIATFSFFKVWQM